MEAAVLCCNVHDSGKIRPRPRPLLSLTMAVCSAAMKPSISSRVFSGPMVTRSAALASALSKPSAVSTWDASLEAAEQAEPELTA